MVKIIQVPEEYEVDKTIMVPKVIQEEREIRIPRPVIEKKTVRVPKQRIITEEEEVRRCDKIFFLSLLLRFVLQHTITVPATEEITETVTVPRVHTTYQTAAPVYHQAAATTTYPAQQHSFFSGPTTSYAGAAYQTGYGTTYGGYQTRQ